MESNIKVGDVVTFIERGIVVKIIGDTIHIRNPFGKKIVKKTFQVRPAQGRDKEQIWWEKDRAERHQGVKP